MSKAMARQLSSIEVGKKFNDSANGRYIEVDYIYDRDLTARCTVFEFDEDGYLDKEYYQTFGLEELLHFDEVKA